MRCWTRRSSRPRPELAGLGLLLALGCVSRGEHDAVSAQLVESESRAVALERSVEALQSERGRLFEEIEGLRAEIDVLRGEKAGLERDLESRGRELVAVQDRYGDLIADLESEVQSGQIQIEQLRDGLRLQLAQEILFSSGSARLNAGGAKVLRTVAGRVAKTADRVEVQGHTDDRALHGAAAARYPTNWELAGARAASVVRVLEDAGVEPSRLAAVSYGSQRPRVSNETAEGRAQNRRIEIRLVPRRDAVDEELAPSESGEAEDSPGPPSDEPEAETATVDPSGETSPPAEPPTGAAPATGPEGREPPTGEPPAADPDPELEEPPTGEPPTGDPPASEPSAEEVEAGV